MFKILQRRRQEEQDKIDLDTLLDESVEELLDVTREINRRALELALYAQSAERERERNGGGNA